MGEIVIVQDMIIVKYIQLCIWEKIEFQIHLAKETNNHRERSISMNNIELWCHNLTNFWQHKEINKIIDLFDQNVIYYEEPNNQISYNELENIWSEIKEQNTSDIEHKILIENDNKCVVNFLLHGNTTIDMIYEIKLNEENKCIYFKQWYMEY